MKKGIVFRRGLFGYKKKDVLDYFELSSDGTASMLKNKEKEVARVLSDMDELRDKLQRAEQKMQFYKNDNQDLRDSNVTLTSRLEQKDAEAEELREKLNVAEKQPQEDTLQRIEELEQIIVTKNNEIAMLKGRLFKGAAARQESAGAQSGAFRSATCDGERDTLLERIKDLSEQLKSKDDDFYRQKQEYLALIMKQGEDKKLAEDRILELEEKLNRN